MSETLLAFNAAFLSIACIFIIVYLLGDLIQFTRAMWRAKKSGRLDEWFVQTNRLQFGSGYRLFKVFKKDF